MPHEIKNYEGRIERCDKTGFSGWAYDKKNPDTPVDIEIADSSTQTLVGTVTADIYRKDLKDAGIGNGCHAFRFDLPDYMADGKEHTITAKIVNTDFFLSANFLTVNIPVEIEYEGYIEFFDKTGFSGWAYSKKTPDASVDIEIYDAATQTLIDTVTADIYRKDLEDAGIGNGCHAFRFDLPDYMADGKEHTITAKIVNTDFFLSANFLTVNIPIEIEYEGYIEVFDKTGFSGWAYSKKNPDTPVDIEIYDSSTQTLIDTVTADTYRKDLEESGIGNGCHAFRFDFPDHLADGNEHTITAKIVNTDFFLSANFLTVNIPVEIEYEGYIEGFDKTGFSGWAYNKKNPDTPVDIEIYDSSTQTHIGTVPADTYRKDLEESGIGNGCHAFHFFFPEYMADNKTHTISVKIRNTDYILKDSPFSIGMNMDIEFITADITDNCNLRCPFCPVTHKGLMDNGFMTIETFTKVISFLPYLPAASFYLSSLYEPTLHPELAKFLELIPLQLRKRVLFTTNLAANLSDNILVAMSKSGIHHINILADTLNPSLYPKLRKGGIFDRFINNLERLASLFSQQPRAPELHYITVALKSNMGETPDIVTQCAKKYAGVFHEIRYPFNVTGIDSQWKKDNFITDQADWDTLEKSLKDTGVSYVIHRPPENYYGKIVSSADCCEARQPQTLTLPPGKPIQLRIDYKGTIRILNREDDFHVNVNLLDNPVTLVSTFF
ncbi:MAG: radical SAM protein [Nitrospirae bacterium]|nr:radical SAM protein [Nitrospirota bacterium]MBF0535112.1 radical SAM protein [Nitrospirota bacterium]MBF0615338.1 radical SAM protein [Nitrospirota bacterium]